MANNSAADLWFFPFSSTSPKQNNVEKEWSDDFVFGTGTERHLVGYNCFFLIFEAVYSWDWSHTTNPDLDGNGERDGPWEPGNSDSSVVADVNINWRYCTAPFFSTRITPTISTL